MAKLYARKILIGEMTLEEVPIRWRAETGTLIEEKEDITGENE